MTSTMMGMSVTRPDGSKAEWQPDPRQQLAAPTGPNGRDPMSGLPWWVKAIVIVGVPSAISLGLVWSDRMQLRDTVISNGTQLAILRAAEDTHNRMMTLQFDFLSKQGAETNRILVATCINAARNDAQRNECVGRR